MVRLINVGRDQHQFYPFGCGLSYTTFEFKQNMTGNGCDIDQQEPCAETSNTGNRGGHETLFVFVYPPTNEMSNNEPAKT